MKIPHAKKWNQLQEITDEIMAVAGGSGSKVGTGGMKSKLSGIKNSISTWGEGVYW